MKEDFKGQRVLITGGSSGIGLELASQLVKQGAMVAIVARNQSKLEAARKELETSAGSVGKVLIQALDVTDEAAARQVCRELVDALGGLDLLICNAGVSHAAAAPPDRT